jgi:hypothetical protein
MIPVVPAAVTALAAHIPACLLNRVNKTADTGYSRLTNRGLPAELAWVWPSGQLRCTLDAAPSLAPAGRYKRSLAMVREAGYTGAVPGELHLLQQALERAPHLFRYGAWLGFRPQRTVPKLYTEIPPHPAVWQLPPALQPVPFGSVPVMLGWQPDSGETEWYFRAPSLSPAGLAHLHRVLGLEDHTAGILRLWESLVQRKVSGVFRTADTGWSVAFDAHGHARALTLYTYVQSLLATDHLARKALLALGRREGWNMNDYAAITSHLETPGYEVNTYHGMVGFVSIPGQPVQCTTGVSIAHFANHAVCAAACVH